jgi:WD40 repeat protein
MKGMLADVAVAALIVSLQAGARSAEPQQTGKAQVRDNMAVVEIAVPAGAQIVVDGQEKKGRREFAVGPLKTGQLVRHELTVQFSPGGTVSKTLLLRGGERYRVPVRDPVAAVPELVLQTGHFGGVWSVAFSPDGTRVLTGGTDNAAIIWDSATANVVRRFEGHKGGVETVVFSRDGKSILTGSTDSTAILWNAATGAKLRVFEGGQGRVALSLDGRFLLMDSLDKTAMLWDVATGKVVRSFEGDPSARRRRIAAAEKQQPRLQSEVTAVAFSADGKRVLTGEAGEQAILWDARTGQQLRTFKGHRGLISSVAFSPDGKTILTGAWDNTAILWDADRGTKLRTIDVHARGLSLFFPDKHYVNSVAFSPDGKSVLTGSWDCTAVLTSLTTGKELTFKGHEDFVTAVAFSPDGRSVLTGARTGGAILWDISTGKQLRTFEGKEREATAVAFSPDEKLLATGYEDGTAITWDTTTGSRAATLDTQHRRIDSVAFTPDGKRLLTGSIDGAILWDVTKRTKLRTFEGSVRSAALAPDGKSVVTWPFVFSATASGERAVLWDAATGNRLRSFQEDHPGNIKVAFSPDSKQMLVGDWSGWTRAYSMETGAETHRFKVNHDPTITPYSQARCQALSVAFSPDGKRILTGLNNRTAFLCDASTQNQLRAFAGHDGWVESVSFSPDGKQVLTGSDDHTVVLWDANTGSKLRVFKGAQSGPICIALFSPKGRFVVASDNGGGLHIWDVATGDELCRIIALSGDDWLTVTPEGLFDGSPGGVRRVNFRIHNGGRMSPVFPEKLQANFHHPGLLAHLLKGERPQPSELDQ